MGQLLLPLIRTLAQHTRATLMNYLLRGIIVSTNGVIRTFHGTVRAESRNCSHELRSPCPGLGSRKSQVTRLVGSAHSRSNRLLSRAVLSFASPPTRSRYVGVAKRELFALLRFNVPGSGCRRSISPGTMVTRSVIRHACIRRFAISTGLYIYIYMAARLSITIVLDYRLSRSNVPYSFSLDNVNENLLFVNISLILITAMCVRMYVTRSAR